MMKPYYQREGVTIYHCDCLDVLADIPSVRLVVTDPPYIFGIASSTQESAMVGSWYDLMNSAAWYKSWLVEVKRLTENMSGAAWIFSSWRTFPVLAKAAYDADWPIMSLLVWDKEFLGGCQKGLRRSYELVALLPQSRFALPNRALPDIWREKWLRVKPTGHPSEKPVALLTRLIHESGRGTVLDPFSGSGSTLIAARALGCEAIGIEIEERYCEMAARRLDSDRPLPLEPR